MLYALFQHFQEIDFPGIGLMNYITFRAGMTLVLSLIIALVFGRKIIDRLQLMQVGEIVRDLGIEGQMQKKGTPTMGGVIIIISILVPCLLLGNLSNIYMMLMIVTTIWMGSIGFLDDWRKLKYHNKEGLKGKYKITVYTPVENQNMFTYSTETKPFEWQSNSFEYDTENPTNVIYVYPTFTQNGFYAGGWKIDYRFNPRLN